MRSIMGSMPSGQKQAFLSQRAPEDEFESMRAAPLSEAIATVDPMGGPSMDRPSAHVLPLHLGLDETLVSSTSAHAMTFNVRAALEIMWDDIHDMEERVDKITRQAHVGLLVAQVKSKSRSKRA